VATKFCTVASNTCGILFILLFWCLEFWDSSWVFAILCNPVLSAANLKVGNYITNEIPSPKESILIFSGTNTLLSEHFGTHEGYERR
jgi:hypothetical protein